MANALIEPSTFKQASISPQATKLMQKQNSFYIIKLEEMTPFPPGCKLIQSKLIFKTKYITDSSIDKYKARLVAKGYTSCKYRLLRHFFTCFKSHSIQPWSPPIGLQNSLFQWTLSRRNLYANSQRYVYFS